MNKLILASEPMSIVTQTEHEKVVKKIEDNHKEQASSQLLQLKKEFAVNFISVSDIIFSLSVHDYHPFTKTKVFCERFSPEERIALEKAIRQHPKYKRHIAFCFGMLPVLGIAYFAAWWWAPVWVSVLLGAWAVGLSPCLPVMYFGKSNSFVSLRHFLLRRKLIRLGGPNAPEDAIKEMDLRHK